MAESNDYTSGLNQILGNLAESESVNINTPQQDIQQSYDSEMDTPMSMDAMFQNVAQANIDDPLLNKYSRAMAASDISADEYSGLDRLRYGSAPNQEILDPLSMIGSGGEKLERSIKAGFGDLLYGTGETLDFINAWARPGDPEPTTRLGDYFKKIGAQKQNENLLVLSDEMKDVTFGDMFRAEFWNSKIARLVPYALSFAIPYTAGARIGGALLGRFGMMSAKALSKADKAKKIMGVPIGTMGKGIGMGNKGIQGSGILGKLAFDAGKKGLAQTKFMRNIGSFAGGGLGANMAEGAYLAGEAYNEMLRDTDEDGNLLFTPDEAASHATDVMKTNAWWVGADAISYGLLFGGVGKSMAKRLLLNPLQKINYKDSVRGLVSYAVRKRLPLLPAAGAYATVEGLTEGIQETHQEWNKYKNIQQAKGEEYLGMTDWVKDSYGNIRPEIRDIFWSSVGLGGAMGGARGYFDAAAERISALNEHQEAINENARIIESAKDPDQYYAAEAQVQDNIIALNVWNYRGDGSVVIEYINNMVKDKKMSQQTADEYIAAVEQAEKNYEKHTVNSILTEEGARQAFFRETRKSRNLQQQELQKKSYEIDRANIKENIKNPEKQKKALEKAEQNHLSIMETLQDDMNVLEREIEDIYTLRVDKAPIAKSTGKRDARFKVQGLTKDEVTEFSQKEAKKADDAKKQEPSVISKVVQGVKGLFGKGKKKIQSVEVKEAIKKIKNYDKTKITSTAKDYLLKALEAGKITAAAAGKIIGTGINKVINRGDVDKAVKKEERTETKEKEKPRYKDKQVPVKTEEFTVYEEDGSVHAKFRAVTRLDGTVEWTQWSEAADRWTPATVIDEKIQKRDNISNEEAIKGYTQATVRDAKTDKVIPSGMTYTVGKVGDYKTVMNPKMFDRLTSDQKQRVDPKRAKADVKKKDQSVVAPKTKEYKETEKSLKDKGIKLQAASISKVIDKEGRASTTSYILKTATGKVIKFFTSKPFGAEALTKTPQNVKLNLVEPVAGQADVVEVNGKLYFQYKKGAPLYESKIEVIVDNKVIGQLQYQDFTIEETTTKKAKKKETRSIDKVVGAVKQTKDNFNKFIKSTFSTIKENDPILLNRNLEVYTDSGLAASALTRSIINKNFPGAKGYVVQKALYDDYGQEATSLAIGATLMINENEVRQSDIIHEAGHIYYSLMEKTPLMKRIKKLLPKSLLYKKTQEEYPELTLMRVNGQNITIGGIYRNALNNKADYTGDIVSISENIAIAERNNDGTRTMELFNELRLQLKAQGIKEVRVDRQRHLLEETFSRTLEFYSYDNVDAVIKGTATQKRLEKDLIEFYKKVKKLTSNEDAKRLLDLSVDNIQSLDLEAAIKHILLDFNSGNRTVPVMQNSAYGPINKAKKKAIRKRSTYSALSKTIGDFMGRGLTSEQIADRVVEQIAKDSELTIKDVDFIKSQVEAVVRQKTRPNDLKLADDKLDRILSNIGKSIGKEEDVSQDGNESQPGAERNFDDDVKQIALPTTTSNFIKKIVEVYNNQNPDKVIDRKKLLYDLYSMSKNTMYDPYDFIPNVRKSGSREIEAMLGLLDNLYNNDKILTNAKLMEIKGPIEGITIEVLSHQALEIKYDKSRRRAVKSFKKYRTISKTLEQGVIRSILKDLNNNTEKGKKLAEVYDNLFKNEKPTSKQKYIAATKYLDIILDDNAKGKLIDKRALLNTEILFDGKRQYLWNLLFEHKRFKNGKPNLKYQSLMGIDKEGKFTVQTGKYKAYGLMFGKQGELKVILTEGLVASRAINYLSMVDNVMGDGVSIFNKENGLHNRAKNIANIINEEIDISKDDIMHPDNNIYSYLLYSKKARGVLTGSNGKVSQNPFRFTIHSGMMRELIAKAEAVKYEGRASKLNYVTPKELVAGDFLQFLSQYNQGIKNKEETIIYDQPIAVFSDKSRRYYIESMMAHNSKTRKELLSRIERNPAYGKKYQKGSDIFPYVIENNRIKNIKKLVVDFKQHMRINKDLYINNEDILETKDIDKAIEAYLTSHIANKFMAQQLFVHDHRQSKDEIDYIKRAAGAIASHVVFDRNTMIEPIIIKDYFIDDNNKITTEETDNNYIENDAMGYVLPEQAKIIREKYGESQKVGNVFKFVYHYTETEGKLKGKTTYLKFAVHTLTRELEAKSEYLKNIGEVLRKRQEQVEDISKTPGNLVIAASESAAKLFLDGIRTKEDIHDIKNLDNIDNIMKRQDLLYKDDTGYRGLSGEGFGIQLELDKQTDERFFPSQLFYNLATNIITEEEKLILKEMYGLRKDVMEANNESRNRKAGLIMNNTATRETVYKERDSFASSVSADIYGVLFDSVFETLDPRYPFANASYNSIARGRITHRGTKMYTKGSIAYQSSSLGMNLKSYEKGLFAEDESIVASEAIVPGYLKDQGVEVGDLFIGTRVPSHGKVTSSVFVVKDFHAQIDDTPTSNITIPAKVSKFWGADLDGDSVHMNFKYTEKEVNERGKSWRKKSNRFFDLYVKLVSNKKRTNEITANIDFVSDSDNAIEQAKSKGLYKNKKQKEESQLHPLGDSEMFNDNVPAKSLVGIVAALQRTFNIFSNNEEKLPFKITLKGESEAVTHDKFFDDPELENGVGNWYGVAQLLNIVLDNAKHQYASKLGLNKQTIFSYIMLRRLGYSLNDLTLLFNSPIVQEYIDFKSKRSKNYISKDSDIQEMFLEDQVNNVNELAEFFESQGVKKLTYFYKQKITGKKRKGIDQKRWETIVSRLKGEGINININDLLTKGKNRNAEFDAIIMLYALDKFNEDVVNPFGKAFTVHQKIEKNPFELRQITQKIKKLQTNFITINDRKSGGLSLPYQLGESRFNSIVEHAVKLFSTVLERAFVTDIRFTPYMQGIINNESYAELKMLYPDKYSAIINRVIINDLKNNISFLSKIENRETLIDNFISLKEKYGKDNIFTDKIIEVTEKGDKVVINRVEVTDFISYKSIDQIKESFSNLLPEEKNLIFELEAEFNGFGFTGGAGGAASFIPFFDNEYINKINDEINTIITNNQTKEPEFKYDDVNDMSNLDNLDSIELDDAIIDELNKNLTTDKKIDKASKQNNTFIDPTKKAKKVISSSTTYNNDYISGDNNILSFSEYLADKGIDIQKIKESKIAEQLYNKYIKYREHYKTVQEFESSLEKKPLSKYNLEDLRKRAFKLRSMDNSATKNISYIVEKEIGKRLFEIQTKKLKADGKRQGYKYKVPGLDGVEQEDMSGLESWLTSNNISSKRPELQLLINEIQFEYRNYLRAFKRYKDRLEKANRSLVRSKNKGLSVLERVRQGFDTNARYKYIYGNIATFENGNIRLLTEEELADKNLTKEERAYYTEYKNVAQELLNTDTYIIPGMQMGTLEKMSRNSLFGLYDNTIDTYDIERVKVYGLDKSGNRVLKTLYEWKYDVYKGRTGKLTLESGRQIYELDKLRRKAKELKAKGINEDGSKILLSDMEYDALINNGAMIKKLMGDNNITDVDRELIEEYERRRGIKAKNISYDINSSLLEFIRGSLFMNGENVDLQKSKGIENPFTGMSKVSILIDSVIAFNKGLDNKNAANYLTRWWKEGFIEGRQQESFLGKTGDKVIDSFVRLTSLRLLGFNMTVGIGNVLAGKYQELRKKGGAQFIKGETRYFKNLYESRDILKRFRIVEYSFDEFIHLSESKGAFGKLEKWSYIFMDATENYIQGAAFLGELTEEEFNNPDLITEERVMQINHKISTLHGEGYTALDASLLSMYSYGRALLQFKKWFVTLLKDRFSAEDIDRFGKVNIGSYRATGEFVRDLFRSYIAGNTSKKELKAIWDNSNEARKAEIAAHLRGMGIGITLLSLIAIMEDDEDSDPNMIRTLKKFSNDVFVTTDYDRFFNYTLVPASYSTIKNATEMIGQSVRGDKIKRSGPYGEKGDSKAAKTLLYDLAPYSSVRRSIARDVYNMEGDKKETSSLIR